MSIRSRPTVLVPLRDRGSFLDLFLPGDGTGGLLIRQALDYDPGDAIDLELNFLQEQRTFRLRGRVAWKRDADSGMPARTAVHFLDEDRDTRELVMEFARGKEIEFVERSDTRFPVSLQISYKTDSEFITDCTDDLSQGGAFIVTERVLPTGTMLPLKVRVPGALLPLKLQGVVCWTRKIPTPGVGVKFVFESERQKKKLAQLVAQMKAEIIQEMQGRKRARSTVPQGS